MSIKEKQAYKLPWELVNNSISEELSTILGRPIRCKAFPDNLDYWAVNLCNYEMPLAELMLLLDEVQASKESRRDSIPEDDDSVRSFGMYLATSLLERRLGCQWERFIADDDALWIVGCQANNTLDIGSRRISFEKLKSKGELMNWLTENGATHTELMNFCEDYRNEYQNELCWHYPISDGKHLGTYLVLVKEGVLSLPYDEADKEDYELFTLEDACLFSKSSDMSDFISDWDNFSNDLRNTMFALFHYLKRTENEKNERPKES